jgi:hypothetical protein
MSSPDPYKSFPEAVELTGHTVADLRVFAFGAFRGDVPLAKTEHRDGKPFVHVGDLLALGPARRIEPIDLGDEPFHQPSANESAPEQKSRGAR